METPTFAADKLAAPTLADAEVRAALAIAEDPSAHPGERAEMLPLGVVGKLLARDCQSERPTQDRLAQARGIGDRGLSRARPP